MYERKKLNERVKILLAGLVVTILAIFYIWSPFESNKKWAELIYNTIPSLVAVLIGYPSAYFTLKWLGLYDSDATREKAEVAAALAVAEAVSSRSMTADPWDIPEGARFVANFVDNKINPRILGIARESTILWVDDQPDNNIYERQTLEIMGIKFVLATSTEEALQQIKQNRFNAIISDMGRPGDLRAGYTLLDTIRAERNQTPFIIYAGSSSSEHQDESKRHGAIGCTDKPEQLVQIVLSSLSRTRIRQPGV